MRCWQHGPILRIRTPAKLNLFLDIHARRPDGFHELETLMVRVGLFDTLRFEEEDSEASHLRIVDSGERIDPLRSSPMPELPADGNNLILRAVQALQDFTGENRTTRITLEKKIPVASGMAGGSSNAAATLVALNHLWQLGLSRDDLFEIGAGLGSDVNFFLSGANAAVCRGRGEIIEPVAVPADLSFVIVRPHTGLSTAEVFRHCRPSETIRPARPLVEALQAGRIGRAGTLLFNALQRPAETINPEIRALRKRFASLPVTAHQMTGSGTAYFGLCSNRKLARRIAARLNSENLGRVFVA